MTKTILTAALLGATIATAAAAGPVEDLIAQLRADGYSKIDIETEGKVVEIEAEKDGQDREILIHAETGEILSDKLEEDDDYAMMGKMFRKDGD